MIIKGNVELIAKEVSAAVQEYLTKEGKSQTSSEEVTDYLVEKGLIAPYKKKKLKSDELDSILNEVSRIGRENLFPGMRAEQVKKKTVWYIDKV